MKLFGKAAVVTGASSGIGLACAERLAADGAHVMLLDLNEATGQRAVEQIVTQGGKAHFAKCDVGYKDAVDRAFEAVDTVLGRVDILVSNAGIGRPAEFVDLSEKDFDDVIRTNLKGMFLCGQAAARRMIAHGGGGSIVNMSSINAIVAQPGGAAYAASKGAVKQLTAVMAMSLAPHGIRVNAIGPGTIETELTLKGLLSTPESRQRVLSRTPLGRCGSTAEVASVASFLVSEDASYITGQTIYPDGGRLALNGVVPAA